MTTDYIEQRAHRAQGVYEDAIRRGETEVDATFLADIACGAVQPPPGAPLYPVECAWCRTERGVQCIVGWSTIEGSHSICERHATELNAWRNGR